VLSFLNFPNPAHFLMTHMVPSGFQAAIPILIQHFELGLPKYTHHLKRHVSLFMGLVVTRFSCIFLYNYSIFQLQSVIFSPSLTI